jgi:hypothetical protein
MRGNIAVFLGTILWLVTGPVASAQVVGTKDLTKLATSSQNGGEKAFASQKPEYCFPSGGNADGVILSNGPILSLSISKADFVIVDQRPSIDLTLALKNNGIGPILVPWSTSPVEPKELPRQNDMKTSGYEVVTVDFYFGRPHTTDGGIALKSRIALWSQPENPDQTIKLMTGESVELKVRADIVCLLPDSIQCISRLRTGKLQVSAWWYQRLLTTTVKDSCIYQTGAYTEYEIDSKTVDVDSTPVTKSQEFELSPISVPERR